MDQKDKIAIFGAIGVGLVLIGIIYGIFFFRSRNTAKIVNPTTSSTDNIVTTTPPGQTMRTVRVYFQNTASDPELLDCSRVLPVERIVVNDDDLAFRTLMELFKGPTSAEKANGFTSVFSSSTANILQNVKIENNVAYVDLADVRTIIPNASASCGSAAFFSSVKETLRDLVGVTEVRYAIFGNPEDFYDWIQVGCTKNDPKCDPTPFKEWYQK